MTGLLHPGKETEDPDTERKIPRHFLIHVNMYKLIRNNVTELTAKARLKNKTLQQPPQEGDKEAPLTCMCNTGSRWVTEASICCIS